MEEYISGHALSLRISLSSFQASHGLNNKNSKVQSSTAHGYAQVLCFQGLYCMITLKKKGLMLMTLTTSKINSWISGNIQLDFQSVQLDSNIRKEQCEKKPFYLVSCSCSCDSSVWYLEYITMLLSLTRISNALRRFNKQSLCVTVVEMKKISLLPLYILWLA